MRDRADYTLQLTDGRRLGFAVFGAPEGDPVFYSHGFPGSRLEAAFSAEAAVRLGLRIIAPDRPGYGLSDIEPRRTICDWPADVAALADHLGIERFGLLGVSGGAPYALACAALLPQRITAAAIVAGLGPTVARGATADMLALHRFFLKLFRHSPLLGALFYTPFSHLLRRFPSAIFSLLAATAPMADREALGNAQYRRILTDSTREAFRSGGKGALRDLFLYTHPWNLPLENIVSPLIIWHGEKDLTVPISMGRALARTIPHARSSFIPVEGHFSLPLRHTEAILSFLAERDGSEG
jgi:pimeloyl-ACP methyl ester carboxylesterase